MRQALVNPGWRPLLLRSTNSSKFFAEDLVAEQVGQPHDGLFDGADALDDLRSLAHQLAEFFMRHLDHLLDMRITATGKAAVSSPAALTPFTAHDYLHYRGPRFAVPRPWPN